METLHSLKPLIKVNDFMVKIDMKDAFWSVPLHDELSRYVAFKWNGVSYKVLAMLFGRAASPRVFTKVTKPVVALLRHIGIRCIIYLDDILLLNERKGDLVRDRDSTLFLLMVLGFTPNWKKCHLQPSTAMDYLGFSICSVGTTLSLPQERLSKITQRCREQPLISVTRRYGNIA